MEHVASPALSALTAIAYGPEACRRAIFQAGGQADAVAALKLYTPNDMPEEAALACTLLSRLASGSKSDKQAVIAAGAPSALRAALQEQIGSPAVCAAACEAVGKLASGSDAHKRALVEAKCHVGVLEALDITEADCGANPGPVSVAIAREGLRALQYLADGPPELRVALVAASSVASAVLTMHRHCGVVTTVEVVRLGARLLYHISCGQVEHVMVLAEEGGLSAAANALSSFPANEELAHICCGIFANAASASRRSASSPLQLALITSSPGPLILAALGTHPRSVKVAERGLAALFRFIRFLDGRAIPQPTLHALAAMQAHPSSREVALWGCAVLAVRHQGPSAAPASDGSIESASASACLDGDSACVAAAAMLGHGLHPACSAICQSGCDAIAYATGSKDGDALPTDTPANVLAAAVSALQTHSALEPVAFLGCLLLRRAASGSTAGLVEAGGLPCLVAAATAHPGDASLASLVCEALGDVVSASEALAQCAVDAGAVPAVVRAMTAHPEVDTISGSGCRLLSDLAAGSEAQKAAVTGGCVAHALVSGLRARSNGSAVVQWAASALFRICAGSDAQKQAVVAAGGLPLLAAVILERDAAAEETMWCCAALNSVASGPAACQQAVLDAGGAAALVSLLRRAQPPGTSAQVVRMACAALASLACGSEAQAREVVAADAAGAVVAVMGVFGGRAAVQSGEAAALRAVARGAHRR